MARVSLARVVTVGLVAHLAVAGCAPPEPKAHAPRADLPDRSGDGTVSARPRVTLDVTLPGECAGDSCWVSADGFRFLHPSPVGHTLESVVAVRPGQAFAVGAAGSMTRLTRDGMTKITIPGVRTPSDALDEMAGGNAASESPGIELQRFRFESVVVGAVDELLVLLEAERMAHFADGRWTLERPGARASFGDRLFGGPEGAFVLPTLVASVLGRPRLLVREGEVFREGPKLPGETIARAGVARGSTVWLGADEGTVLVSRDGGDFVSESLDPPLRSDVIAIWVSRDETKGLLFGRNGEAYERHRGRWIGGDRITSLEGDLASNVEAIWAPPDETEIWIVGDHVMRRRDDLWRSMPTPLSKAKEPLLILEGARYHAVDGTSAEDVWVVGRAGIAAHYDGKTWRSLTEVATDSDFESVVPLEGDRWLAVSRDGVVVEGDGDAIIKVDRLESDDVGPALRARDGAILVEARQRVLQRRDGAWTEVLVPGAPFGPDAAASAMELVSVGYGGRIDTLRGKRVGKIRAPTTRDLHAARFVDRDLWVVGDGEILRGTLDALRVAHAHEGDEYRAIAASSRDDVWFVGASSRWGGVAVHWDGKRFTRHDGFQHHTLYGAAVDGAGGVYAVGRSGAVAHYDGKNWRNLDTGCGQSLLSVLVTPNGSVVGVGRAGTIVARPPALSPR
ncbi:MAG: hypothetical protein JNL21_03935 [Myxococcales bacterium]|nr:hypothetical protein [Myxococcales bacterium]